MTVTFLLFLEHLMVTAVGQFSEAGLHKWMPFVIIHVRSHKRLQSLPGWFLNRHCFTLCITVGVEPRIAKQCKCQYCCSCKNYQGKGMEGGRKVSALFFGWPEDREFVEKMRFGTSYGTSNKLLLVARHILTMGLQSAFKVGSVKLANSQSPPSIPLWRKYAPEVKAAKGHKRCQAKVKGVNNPTWIAQYWDAQTESYSFVYLLPSSSCGVFWLDCIQNCWGYWYDQLTRLAPYQPLSIHYEIPWEGK